MGECGVSDGYSTSKWERVIPGIYAKEGFRIQRLSRGWSWWAVVQIRPDYPRGRARTLREAMAAADDAMARWTP